MNFEQAEKVRAKFNNLGKPTMMNGGAKKGKNTGPVMIRASEMRMPSNLGSFLYQFGQSDKKFIENAKHRRHHPPGHDVTQWIAYQSNHDEQ